MSSLVILQWQRGVKLPVHELFLNIPRTQGGKEFRGCVLNLPLIKAPHRKAASCFASHVATKAGAAFQNPTQSDCNR